jgi:hypothetical protein
MQEILVADVSNENNIDYCSPPMSAQRKCWSKSASDFVEVNYTGGCNSWPEECVDSNYYPYQNCSSAGTYAGATCQVKIVVRNVFFRIVN